MRENVHERIPERHTNRGDKMKENKDVLGSILKTTQMGQLGIEAVADKAVSCGMKDALRSQKEE